jgi:hypothetical protein
MVLPFVAEARAVERKKFVALEAEFPVVRLEIQRQSVRQIHVGFVRVPLPKAVGALDESLPGIRTEHRFAICPESVLHEPATQLSDVSAKVGVTLVDVTQHARQDGAAAVAPTLRTLRRFRLGRERAAELPAPAVGGREPHGKARARGRHRSSVVRQIREDDALRALLRHIHGHGIIRNRAAASGKQHHARQSRTPQARSPWQGARS